MEKSENNDMYNELTGEEQVIKLLDELICLFGLYDKNYDIIQKCYEKIANAKKKNPNFPVTLYLYNKMKNEKLL